MLMEDVRTEPAPAPASCPPAERSAGISILELTATTCRWPMWGHQERPVGGGFYCGAPIAGADVYCAAHCTKAGRAPKPAAASGPALVALKPSESRTPERGPQPRLSRPVMPRKRTVAEADGAPWQDSFRAARARLVEPFPVPAARLPKPAAPVAGVVAEAAPEPVLEPAPAAEKRHRASAKFEPCPAPPARPMATPCGNGRALVRMMARHGFGPRVTVEDVLRTVCLRYDVRRIDILSHRRTARVVMPRQIAMYLARELTLSSLPKIGRLMGGRDHTTVLHACQQIQARMDLNADLARDIAALSCTISATAVERAAAERRWVAA